MVYLDNAATTPLAPEVRQAMRPFLEHEFGNASSVHRLGREARVALEEARETIARAIHAEPREIVFTSGATEADNAAIKGALFHAFSEQKSFERLGIVTTPAEHDAVLAPVKWLASLGTLVTYASLDGFGKTTPEAVGENVTGDTTLVSTMMVNNETGAINPVREIGEVAKARSKALVHTDAVQALGKIPINVKELGVDLLSLSAHKIHGPKGVGALYIHSGSPWTPFVQGGAQERNRRGGTEAVALAIGFAEAIKILPSPTGKGKGGELRAYLLAKLAEIPEVVLHSATDASSSDWIVSITFVPNVLANLEGDALLIRYDLDGIAVSNGAACTSGSQQPSHVLLAMGKSREAAMKSVRVSFSRYTTMEDLDRFLETTRTILHSL